jgi:hypothetical protein
MSGDPALQYDEWQCSVCESAWGTRAQATACCSGAKAEAQASQSVEAASAREMLEALRLHKAWSDSERAGPDYGGQTRDTHPDGELIWRAWWNNQLDLCRRAQTATDAAIAKAEGK